MIFCLGRVGPRPAGSRRCASHIGDRPGAIDLLTSSSFQEADQRASGHGWGTVAAADVADSGQPASDPACLVASVADVDSAPLTSRVVAVATDVASAEAGSAGAVAVAEVASAVTAVASAAD